MSKLKSLWYLIVGHNWEALDNVILKPVYHGKIIKIVSKPCYYIVHERMGGKQWGMKDKMVMKYAVDKKGNYLGDTKDAYRLVNKYGISIFEKTESTHCVCSIGYNLHKKKWYGWSHRAIHGFKKKRDAIRFAKKVS